MSRRDHGDLISGSALVIFGSFTLGYAYQNLNIGTLRAMGPGAFPAALSSFLIFTGLMVVISGLRRRISITDIQWKPLAFVSLGIIGFGFTVGQFGLAPAIFILVLVSSLADSKFSIRNVFLLTSFLCLLTFLIFSMGLGLSMPILNWRT